MIQQVDELKVVGAVVVLPVERIVRNPDQPRKRFQEKKLLELGTSMKEAGQDDPVRVFPIGDGVFMLQEGERRWRGAQKVGLTELRCIIVPRPDQRTLLEKSLIAGVQRENLSPMEEAAAYHQLRSGFGMSAWQISRRVGKSDAHVRGRIIWMDERIPAEVRELIDDGQFPRSPNVAEALFSLPSNDVRLRLAQKMAGKTPGAIIAACTRFVEMQKAREEKAKEVEVVAPVPSANGHQPVANGSPVSSAALRLAVNGTQPPAAIPLATVRALAGAMCQTCELRGNLLEKLPEPAWYLVAQAAADTCATCGLSYHDLSLCKRCQAVDLIRRMVKGVS